MSFVWCPRFSENIMSAIIIPAAELSPDLINRWLLTTRDNPLYCSPNLRPEVIRTIGQFNPRAFVGFEEGSDGGSLFFPFEWPTRLASIAGPVPMCDYQAFIAAEGHPIVVSDLMRQWKLSTWVFENLIAPTEIVAQTTTLASTVSRRVVMREGFGKYLAEMAAMGKSVRKQTTNLRLLNRDHGEVRFVSNCGDDAVLSAIFHWKADRFNAGESTPWVERVVEALYKTRKADFSGMLSALYAGDRLVAAHFGVRSDTTLYYWFPAFNPEFGRYTPGGLLIYFLLQNLKAMKCDVLDFGPGGERYKEYFSNSAIPVHRGFVELPSVLNVGRATWRYAQDVARGSKTARFILRPLINFIRRGTW
jgi:CelD/BcsL family acetyltransferase involved in cellulose biosynthesis